MQKHASGGCAREELLRRDDVSCVDTGGTFHRRRGPKNLRPRRAGDQPALMIPRCNFSATCERLGRPVERMFSAFQVRRSVWVEISTTLILLCICCWRGGAPGRTRTADRRIRSAATHIHIGKERSVLRKGRCKFSAGFERDGISGCHTYYAETLMASQP